jgi:hypothetical protein
MTIAVSSQYSALSGQLKADSRKLIARLDNLITISYINQY